MLINGAVISDETSLLSEGEVFCQFQENEEMEPRIIQSEVIVCRAPACKPSPITLEN